MFFWKTRLIVVPENRKLWKAVSPLFLEKVLHKEFILLNNNNKTISNNVELGEICNKHFSKIVQNLDIDETMASNIADSDTTDPVFNAIEK